MFYKKGFLKNFGKIKETGHRPNFIEKETPTQVLSFDFPTFLRTPFLQNTSEKTINSTTKFPNIKYFLYFN